MSNKAQDKNIFIIQILINSIFSLTVFTVIYNEQVTWVLIITKGCLSCVVGRNLTLMYGEKTTLVMFKYVCIHLSWGVIGLYVTYYTLAKSLLAFLTFSTSLRHVVMCLWLLNLAWHVVLGDFMDVCNMPASVYTYRSHMLFY